MKILFITDLYPVKTEETTTPVTLHNFVIEWINQGHKVNVIKSNFVFNSLLRGKPFYKDGFYDFEGVNICNLNYYTPFFFNVLNKIPSKIKYADYDVIVAHMPAGIILADKIARTIRKPLVCSVHYSDLEVLTKPIYSIYFKNRMEGAYKRAKKIACRSFVLQNKFKKIMPKLAKKTFIAASGVNEKIVTAEKTLFETRRTTRTVLACANLIKRKNIDKLILAFKDVDNLELKIIGDGEDFKNLKILGEKNLNIKFLGRLPRNEVLEEMKKADIFILPSVNESFGMVYIEAMASGCLTVCTKDDGIDGIIIDGENGFLCEPTVEGIKEVLLKIKALDALTLGQIKKNSITTVKQYTREICAKNYIENIIQSI